MQQTETIVEDLTKICKSYNSQFYVWGKRSLAGIQDGVEMTATNLMRYFPTQCSGGHPNVNGGG